MSSASAAVGSRIANLHIDSNPTPPPTLNNAAVDESEPSTSNNNHSDTTVLLYRTSSFDTNASDRAALETSAEGVADVGATTPTPTPTPTPTSNPRELKLASPFGGEPGTFYYRSREVCFV